jgi:hypothetical protein
MSCRVMAARLAGSFIGLLQYGYYRRLRSTNTLLSWGMI